MSDKWTLLMVGPEHGIVGSHGHPFQGHPDFYERVDVVRADRADAALAERDAEIERLRKRREDEYARMLEWRGIEHGNECKGCGGAGVTTYGSTATWRGGAGGQTITAGICDKCWGSGQHSRPWISLRKLEADRQRARLPEELIERLIGATNDGFDDQSAWSLFNDILAWHEQGGSNNE